LPKTASQNVVEVVCNAAGHGAYGLASSAAFTQLVLRSEPLRLSPSSGGQIARKLAATALMGQGLATAPDFHAVRWCQVVAGPQAPFQGDANRDKYLLPLERNGFCELRPAPPAPAHRLATAQPRHRAKRERWLPSASWAGHSKSAMAAGLKTVMRSFSSTHKRAI